MLLLLLALLLIAIIILSRSIYGNNLKNEYIHPLKVFFVIMSGVLLFTCIMIYISVFTLYVDTENNKYRLEVLEEENIEIEQKLNNIILAYVNHESNVYLQLISGADPSTLILVLPELSSKEAVNSIVTVYYNNNVEIKRLRLDSVNNRTRAFWLWFGSK